MPSIKDLPYGKMVKRKCYMDKGNPTGKGNIAFILSNTLEQSLKITEDKENLIPMSYYHLFYYSTIYRGKVGVKRYYIKMTDKNVEIKKQVSDSSLTYIVPNDLNKLNVNKNMYYDLSKNYEIFKSLSKKIPNSKRLSVFWNYFKSIINVDSVKKWDNYNCIITDVKNFPNIKGGLKKCGDNPVFLLYWTLYRDYTLLSDLDIDFIFYHKQGILKINPSTANKDTYRVFLTELKKLYKLAAVDIKDELEPEVIAKDERKDNIVNELKKSLKFNFTGNDDSSEEETVTSLDEADSTDKDDSEDHIDDFIDKTIEKKVDEAEEELGTDEYDDDDTVDKAVLTSVENEVNNDEELIKEIYQKTKNKELKKSAASTARDNLLRKKQEDIVVGNMTVGQLKKLNSAKVDIKPNDVSSVLHTSNKNLQKSKYPAINKTYLEKVYNKDLVDAIMALNNKSLPIFVRNITIEDTSNELNYIDTYTVELEDANRQRSTFKIDIPKFIDNKFMYIGGNKKLILNQSFLLPLVKTSEDAVQIVTNYNKMYVRRDGTKSLSSIEVLMKILNDDNKLSNYFLYGRVFENNKDYITNIEYDELSKIIRKFKCKDTVVYFDQIELHEALKDKSLPTDSLCIGTKGGKLILIDHNTQRTSDNKGIVDIIIEAMGQDVIDQYLSTKTPKRMMYAKVKSMEKDIPCIALCGLWEGFSTVFKKMDLKYRLSDKYPKDLKTEEAVIRFQDCYLVYDNTPANALMMNGIKIFNTEKYPLSSFDDKDPYLDILVKIYGKVSIANALDNTYEFTIDPISEEVLKDMGLPTDLVSLIIYATRLLADNQYTFELNQRISRVRSIETIPAILYDTIAKNYITYKNSNGRKKFTIPRESVIAKLMKSPNVEDYSTLNPILELDRAHTVSYKGWRGINLDESYTVAKRSYDPSMIGIVGPTTQPDGGVGVQKVLSAEPEITSVRGYTKKAETDKDIDNLKDVNLFTPAELITPLAVSHDDPSRVGHAIKQSKHVIPVKNASPVLISNGMEEFCKYDLSTDFVVNAKDDGKVVELSDKENIMVVEYKDGTHQAINLAPNIVKNGGGGFYESLIMTTKYKVGDKFKKNETIAWNKDFFHDDEFNGCRFSIGILSKVAIMSNYDTAEDGTMVTDKLAHDAVSEMTFLKSIVIGKNANVSKFVKVGDHVEIGDPLAEFDTSFEDPALNQFLAVLGDNEKLKGVVNEGSKNIVKASHAGVIEDIKVFSTVELDELSPSLKKIVGNYFSGVKSRKKLLDKYDKNDSIVKCGMFLTDPSTKVNPSKYGVIRGEKVEDAVLIEVYIKHEEYLETGSKIACFTGLKNTITEVIPKGYEPYSELHPEEEISTLIASNSILKRMVPSLIVTVVGNKVIIELKRWLKKFFDSKPFNPTNRKTMENMVYSVFTALDKTGENTKKYKALFNSMSDKTMEAWWKKFFNNDKAYLILDVVDYERVLKMEDVEKAAKLLKIPLFEYVAVPSHTMDKNNVIWSQDPVPVGYLHIKRTQQTIMKKNGMSISSDKRSALVGQVTGSDKNGRESDLDNILLLSVGFDNILKELNGPRADDMKMQTEMMQQIALNGYVKYDDLTNDVKNKTTLNTVNAYMIGMGLDSDLVTKGLMLAKTVEDETR